MRLELGGQPIHTRALSVVVDAAADGGLQVAADLLDLRKRGFAPVGTELQGAGVIHQMGLDVHVDAGGTVTGVAARQPVVAFEASAATFGESCREVTGRLAALVGMRLDDGARLRDAVGGAAGCSHLLAVGQLLCATAAGVAPPPPAAAVHQRLLRRDLVIDGHEAADGRLLIGIQLADLASRPAAAEGRAIDRFAAHAELRLRLELEGWPARIAAVAGAARCRRPEDFAAAPWRDLAAALAAMEGLSLGRGAAQALRAALAGEPAARDALLQLGPALIQCRASFPDKWLNVAATAPDHPGLVGMPDSCHMWRRGGALERRRA